MMVMSLGPTVWIAVGETDVPVVVQRLVADAEASAAHGAPPDLMAAPPRIMPIPAPLAMPLQDF